MSRVSDSNGPTIALIAGEASGDQLGGKLITALRQHFPKARFVGVGGRHMRESGFECWWDRDELSVMGLFEVLRDLPRLLRLRRALRERLLATRPDVVVGIDAPDFNLGLEKQLKKQGLRTVHYVSPTVWAWRSGRAAKIGKAADLVLCLFPFEPAFYADHAVNARYTGHPMADAIVNSRSHTEDKAAARAALGLPTEGPLVALLPGSRAAEVSRLAAAQIAGAAQLAAADPSLSFVAGLADTRTAGLFEAALENSALRHCPRIVGQALEVMRAADVVICASGTATLECMLINRPMVVIYRLAPSTHWVAATFKLVKSRFIALPNILADEALVPELIQEAATGPAIAAATRRWLDDGSARARLEATFYDMHEQLRQDAAASAANAIVELLQTQR